MIGAAFLDACEAELRALKPGNVHDWASGHRMTAADFRLSAALSLPAMADPAIGVGQRIERAMRAVITGVGQNTNLGILLLAAPLVTAAHRRLPDEPLPAALARVLDGLDRQDAAHAFQAIRLAAPAGLGHAAAHDVADEPAGTLLEAMRSAAGRDMIARQYATGFAWVLEEGVPCLLRLRARGWPEPWPLAGLHMRLLAGTVDSHVQRKHGPEVAARLIALAAPVAATFLALDDPASATPALLALDRQLKQAGINPGTSADLVVASHLAADLLA